MDPQQSSSSRGGLGLPTTAGLMVVAVLVAAFRGGAPTPSVGAPLAVPRAAADEPRTAPDPPPRFAQGSALLQEFFGEGLPQRLCATGKGDCYRLDAVVATVPDPAETRLDWNYDVAVEALQRAHESAGFLIDRFWLPPTGEVTAGQGAAATRLPRRRVEPGVILFRHRDADSLRLRLLYLVGEVPTSGVHRRALANALDEQARLRVRADSLTRRWKVPVVGPVFSGSAPSLRRALDAWLAAADSVAGSPVADAAEAPAGGGTNSGFRRWSVAVVSGSATSPANERTLTRADGRSTYRPTVNTDARLDAELGVLLKRLDIDSSRVAVLHEGTTQYGGGFAAETRAPGAGARRGFLFVPFPMNISALRREAQGTPEAQAVDPRFIAGAPVESRVALTLRDSARSQESPPVVSPLTSAATEVLLEEIMSTLRHHGIRMVGLQGTDVRDKLFLAEQIRRRMRDVQFFTYESNSLYLRGDRNSSLRGMLVLSSYPLILENQWWTGFAGERLAFTSDAGQGVYNATLAQLGVDRSLESQMPFTREHKPAGAPVWVSVVGTRHFLPLTVAPGERADKGAPNALPHIPHQQASGPLAIGGAVLLALALAAAAAAARRGSVVPRPQGAPVPARSRPRPPVVRRTAVLVGESEGLGMGVGLLTEEEREGVGGAGARQRNPFYAGALRVFRGRPPARRGPVLRPTAALRREVHSGSLLLHRQIYTGLRLLALAAGAAPLFLLLWKEVGSESLWLLVTTGVGALAWLAGMTWVVRAAAGALRRYGRTGLAYTLHPDWWRSSAGRCWMLETVGRTLVALFGAAFAGLTGWLLWQINALGDHTEAPFALFLYRSLQLGGGVSPLVPILVTAAGFVLWSSWHVQRITLLMRPTAFEYACVVRAEQGARRDAPGARDRIARAVADLRDRLFLLVPHPNAYLLAVGLLVLLIWMVPQLAPTLEAAVLGSGDGRPVSFDVLLRVSVCASLVSTTWAVYRLITVWRALQRMLTTMEETPLSVALGSKRLPPYVARLTRLTLAGAPRYALDALVAERLHRLRTLYRAHPRAIEDAVEAGALSSAHLGDPPSRAALSRTRKAREELMKDDRRWSGRDSLWSQAHPGEGLLPICAAMEDLWAHPTPPPTPTPEDDQAAAARGVQCWREAAEDFVAAQVVDYLDVVLQQFRRLAIFLFVSLLLTTLLLSAYPFHPQSLVKLVFLAVLAATVGSLLLVMTQMNSDATLSRIAGTDEGRITWDTPFVLNALLVAVVPLLTLFSSEFPALRAFVFAWVDPLLKSLGGS